MGIEVKNLVKSFDKKVILDDISFKVDDGKSFQSSALAAPEKAPCLNS